MKTTIRLVLASAVVIAAGYTFDNGPVVLIGIVAFLLSGTAVIGRMENS